MAYTKTVYVNDNPPAINAANLNHMEQGIYNAGMDAEFANSAVEAVYNGEYNFHGGYILNGLSVGATCDYYTILDNANFKCTVIKGLKQGTKFHIQTNDGNSARAYAWLNSSGVVVEVPTKFSVKTLTQITCPSGASILVVNLNINETVDEIFYRDGSIEEVIDDLNVSQYVQKAGVGQVTIDNCDFTVTEQSVNMCDPSLLMWNKGIDASGNIVDSQGQVLTAKIAVGNTYAYFARNGVLGAAARLGLYKKDGTFERIQSAQGTDVSNCNYIQAAFNYTTLSDDVFVGFSSTQSAPTIDSYKHKVVIKDENLPDAEYTNEFQGLSGVAFGTSLTARAYEDHKYEYSTYGYLTYLREYSGMTIDNQGIGGARILADGDKSIYTAIMNYQNFANKDVCIVEGFVNDWDKNSANALGTYTDTTTNTVCGRLRSALNYILGQNANLTVFVILDHYGQDQGGEQFSSPTVKNGYTQYQYHEELKKVCDSMGIICIEEFALAEISELSPQFLADYIHLNNMGAKQSGKAIWNKMRSDSPKFTS